MERNQTSADRTVSTDNCASNQSLSDGYSEKRSGRKLYVNSRGAKRGTGVTYQNGYRKLLIKSHPRADDRGFVFEHIVIAEKAFGGPLPAGSVIHHINEIHDDNRPENLVICPGPGYHKLLHVRLRILKAGGDPNTHKICSTCKKVKDLTDFFRCRSNYDGLGTRCKKCHQAGIHRASSYRTAPSASSLIRGDSD